MGKVHIINAQKYRADAAGGYNGVLYQQNSSGPVMYLLNFFLF